MRTKSRSLWYGSLALLLTTALGVDAAVESSSWGKIKSAFGAEETSEDTLAPSAKKIFNLPYVLPGKFSPTGPILTFLPGRSRLINPANNYAIRSPSGIPSQLFTWDQPTTGASPDSYRFYLEDADDPRGFKTTPVNIPHRRSRTTTSQIIPPSLANKRILWSVAACRDTNPFLPLCGPKVSRILSWNTAIAAPNLRRPANGASIRPPSTLFEWSSVRGASSYLFCASLPGVACPTNVTDTNQTLVVERTGYQNTAVEADLSRFIGKTVHWSVAACNERGRCTYQQSVGTVTVVAPPPETYLLGGAGQFRLPITPPSETNDSEYGTSTSGLWGTDANLVAPTITSVQAIDNAILVMWDDNVNTTHTGYLLCYNNCSELSTHRIDDPFARGAWILDIPLFRSDPVMLKPGAEYSFEVNASGHGLSPGAVTQRVSLTKPTIRIGDSSGAEFRPSAFEGFAVYDSGVGDGVVRDAAGSGGVFPFYPSNSGANPVARAGNRFDTGANFIVGYYFKETVGGDEVVRFVAFHFFLNPATGEFVPISVLYGDAQNGTVGTQVRVGGIQASNYEFYDGNVPVIKGEVSAPTGLYPDHRIVYFNFNLALTGQ